MQICSNITIFLHWKSVQFPQDFFLYTNMAAVFVVLHTNMAAVTSGENDLWERKNCTDTACRLVFKGKYFSFTP